MRWSVTYTKHIKQKRKVYQDGYLDLDISTDKAKLYDECDKLLECRILKKDEVVSSGETLTFNAYLVDVGDPEGDCKPIPDLNFQGRDKKISEQKLRNNSISSGDVKKKKAQLNSISPSQKIIREFKKRELHNYGTPLSSPVTAKSDTTEWQVLYTTQVTQKAKKYHDGFLRLAACIPGEIKLFDEKRKLLDSRFLRKDEVIRSGESIAFDGHLVEIGECEDIREPLADLKVQRNSCNVAGKLEELQRQQNCIKSNKYDEKEFKKTDVPGYGASQNSPVPRESNITEWQVMYTTHVTQKAKKYHDGFLKLEIVGSLQRQVKLYDDGRKLLNSRFLKRDEIITSGESIAFDAHLVDIGKPQVNREVQMDVHIQGNNRNDFQNARIMHRHQNCLKADKSGKPQSKVSSREITDSSCSTSADGIKLSKDVSTNRPLRDVIQILSFLQKPMAVKSNDAGSTDNCMKGQLSSAEGLKDSDTVLNVPDDNQESSKNTDIDGPNEVAEIGNCPDLLSSKSMSNGLGDDRRISSKEAKSGSKVDELPSFDLGF